MTRGVKSLIAILLLIFCAAGAFAAESDLFVKTVPVTKIYTHEKGFMLLYWKSDLTLGTLYIPLKWFEGGANAKAEIIYGAGSAFPYISIFWKGGEFDHVRLYLVGDLSDPSWGSLPANNKLDKEFDIDTLNPEF